MQVQRITKEEGGRKAYQALPFRAERLPWGQGWFVVLFALCTLALLVCVG